MKVQPRFQSPGGAVLIQTLLLIPPLSIPALDLPCASLCISQAESSSRAVTPCRVPLIWDRTAVPEGRSHLPALPMAMKVLGLGMRGCHPQHSAGKL